MANCAFTYEENTKSYKELVQIHGPIVAKGIMAQYNGRPPRRYYEEAIEELDAKAINETQRFTETDQRDVIDSITYEFITKMGSQTADELLGTGAMRGTIPLKMLRNSYIVEETGEMVDAARAKALFELEVKLDDSTLSIEEYDEALNAFDEASSDILKDEEGFPTTLTGETNIRDAYFDIYQYWNGGISTVGKTESRIAQDRKAKNNDIIGWRELLERKVNAAGYVLEQKDLGYELADDQDIIEKIYGRSVVQEDPSKKLTGKIRQTLSTLPSGEKTFLGYNSFIDADTVYADLAKEFSGSPNFESMKLRIANLAKHKPQYAPVSQFMQTMDKRKAVQFKDAFSLSTREFVMMRIGVIEGELKAMISNPNMNSVEKQTFTEWNRNAIEGETENLKAIYAKDAEGNLTLKNPAVVKDIQSNAKIAIEASLRGEDVTTTGNEIHPAVQAYAEVTYAVGINLSAEGTLEKHASNVQSLVNNGHTVPEFSQAINKSGAEMFKYLVSPGRGAGLQNIVSNFVAISIDKGTVKYEAPTATPGNIYKNQQAAVEHIANFAPVFKENRGDAFVNMTGDIIHPINLPHNLSRIVESLQAPGMRDVKAGTIQQDMMEMYYQSAFHKPHKNSSAHQSLLLKALADRGFQKEFKVEVLDGTRTFGETYDYENFAEAQSLTTRLTAWYNNDNSKLCKIAVPTQADRTQLALMTLPRFSSTASKFGIDQKTKKGHIKDLIIQDLARIHAAEKVVAVDGSIVDQEVYSRNENYYKNGKAVSDESMQLADTGAVNNRELRTENNSQLTYRMSDKIMDYLEAEADPKINLLESETLKEVDTALNEMADGVIAFLEEESTLLQEKMSTLGVQFGQEKFWKSNTLNRKKGSIKEFADGFVFDDMVGRLEITKILRGTKAQFKNTVDFYKRMALVTTPGLEVALKEDVINSPEVDGIVDYGMPSQFTELILEDFKLDLTPQQIERVNATAKELYEGAKRGFKALGKSEAVAEAEAARIRDAYRQDTGGIDATDAQSFITLKHYRDIEQGLGNWGIEEEKAWQQYDATGKFVYQPGFTPEGFTPGEAVPINPQKPFYEKVGLTDGVITTDVTKNSYHVLLATETEDNPVKDELRRRMEDSNNPIDVVNFETTKKVRKSNVANIKTKATDPKQQLEELEGKLQEVKINTLDSKNLRFPLIIPPSKSDLATFNRQVRKNTLANVQDELEYELDSGTTNAQRISGKDLKKVYHQAINRKIQLGINQLKKELKISDLEKASSPQERQRAMQNMHQELRRIIEEENIKRDLPDNYSRGLQISEDAVGNPQFDLSLDFPTYYEKFERIILGIAVNRVFKQKLSGQETVQVADVGGYGTSEELKFYSIENDSKGNPRVSHMEVALRADIAAKLGLKEGQEITPEQGRLIGYRIPNQGKSSTVLLRVKKILPNNYKKAIIVPGQITKLTGSDFDIDKMFLIFPEMNSTEEGLKKIQPSYGEFTSGETNVSKINDERVLNNIIYDTIEAIQSSMHHFNETLAPLDETTLKDLAEEMEKAAGLSSTLNFNSFTSEVDAGIRNTLGVALRGLWANALSGHSVAQHGDVNVVEDYAIKLTQQINDKEETETHSKLRSTATSIADDIDAGVPINIILSRYVSAAVDAGKKPFQYALNDNVATFPVELYWTTFAGDTKSLHYFLNQPVIRKAVELVQGKYGGNTSKFKDAFGEALGFPLSDREMAEATQPMSIEELKSLTLNEKKAAINFLKFLEAGRDVRDLFKVIAPDSMDGMNSADSLKSYKSRQNKFSPDTRTKGSVLLYGRGSDTSPVTQFLEEDGAFPMSSGFNDLFNFIENKIGATVFSKVFSPAMRELEIDYMEATGKSQVRPEEMKELRRAAMLHAMTRPGSPIREFFSRTHLETRYLNKESNLVTQFNAITNTNPKLKENKFIAKFTENKDNETESIMLLDFDTSQKMSKFEKDSIIQDAKQLMEFPEDFASNPGNRDQVRAIQDLVEDLFANALITNGFRVSNNSYADLIPVEFFTDTRHSRYGQEGMEKGERFPKSVSEVYKEQNLADQNYFTGFIGDYLRQHGTRYVGGAPMLSIKKMPELKPVFNGKYGGSTQASRPVYKVFKEQDGDQSAVYQLAESGNYYKLNKLGGRIMESLDLGQKSLIHTIEKMSTGQSTSYVNLFDDVNIRAQVPNVTFDSLRGNPTGVNDNIDVICK